MTDKNQTDHERYPEVAPFVRSMYAELAANAHKGDQAGWRTMTLRQAWGEIAWHNAKMAQALKDNNEPLIRELAADVANGAMMLVDILDQLTAAPKPLDLDPLPWTTTPWGTQERFSTQSIVGSWAFAPRPEFEQDETRYSPEVEK